MTISQDELWIDMVQFDTRLADRVWEGDLRDPDAPGWYTDMGSLIRQARGPAEPAELVDEPVVVATMHRVTLGATVASLPRRSGVRVMGRVVAMKAAAAGTTAGMVGVAAATTTGIVATVAATMVVPAINQHVVPIIGDNVPTAIVSPTTVPERSQASVDCVSEDQSCTAHPADRIVVEAPAGTPAAPAPEPAIAGTSDPTAASQAATASDPELADTGAPTTTTTESEPAAAETTSTESAPSEPATTDQEAAWPAAEPASPRMAPAPADPAPSGPAAAPHPGPADPGPPAADDGPTDEVAPAPDPAPALAPAPEPTSERVPRATSSGRRRPAPIVGAGARAVG